MSDVTSFTQTKEFLKESRERPCQHAFRIRPMAVDAVLSVSLEAESKQIPVTRLR